MFEIRIGNWYREPTQEKAKTPDLEKKVSPELPFVIEEAPRIEVQREKFPIIYSENDSLSEWEGMIEALPVEEFDDAREKELERIAPYLDAFAELYGIDLRTALRTRAQILNAMMVSSPVMLENRLEKGSGVASQDGSANTFFEGRMKGGKFDFNANGVLEIGKYQMIYSVLKRKIKTKKGDEYEQDYPALSFSRAVIKSLKKWTKLKGPHTEDDEQDQIARRVHDWFHLAVLYDTQAQSQAFKAWSSDVYFVEHKAKGAGRINYELLANHVHFRVWQKIFEKDPSQKANIIAQAKRLLTEMDEFSKWLVDEGENQQDAHDQAMILTYGSIRGLVDIISFEDAELVTALGDHWMFQEVIDRIPEESKQFLRLTYSEDLTLPFDTESDQEFPVRAILQRYVDGLTVERITHNMNWNNRTVAESNRTWEQMINEAPVEIRQKIAGKSPSTYSIKFVEWITQAEKELTSEEREVWKILMANTETDKSGFWYLKIDQSDFDFDAKEATEVTQAKTAIVFQIPYDHPAHIRLKIHRPATLLATQSGAETEADPGEVVVFNCRDGVLAKKILEQSIIDGQFNAEKCIKIINNLVGSKKVEYGDIYPMDIDVAVRTFDLQTKGSVSSNAENKPLIKPGFYKTPENKRKAYQIGPVSIDSGRNGERRKILKGAVVQNHIKQEGKTDVFPVHSVSFNRHYDKSWQSLSDLQLLPTYREKIGIPEHLADAFKKFLPKYFELLNDVNNNLQLGPRGKPEVYTYPELQKK